MDIKRNLARSRRPALLAAALLALLTLMLPSQGAARAAGKASGRPDSVQSSPIKHVVVLYMENHSFDNLLGFWCRHHLRRCPDGGMPSSVTLSNGAVVKPRTDPDVVPIVQHNAKEQLEAIDGGKMDGWQLIPGCPAKASYRCISGYWPSQEPNLAALANKFAISDRFFSLADSPSWGGHLDIVTSNLAGFPGNRPKVAPGVPHGMGWGCDSDKVEAWSATPGAATQVVPGCIPDPALTVPNGGAFEPTPVPYEPTIMDRLNGAGLPWKLYTAGCAQEQTAPSGLMLCSQDVPGYDWAICPTIAECLYSQTATKTGPDDQFFTDAAGGNLPAFSIVVPGGSYAPDSEHNGGSMTSGDNFIGQVANAIMTGPQWSSTALFITWDDCGCFYDQVPPPLNADGTQEGPRLPLVIVSPYARPAYTDTTSASLSSILAYTEHNFGLSALGVNDAAAYDLSDAFNYAQTPLKRIAMVTRPVPRGEHINWAQLRQVS